MPNAPAQYDIIISGTGLAGLTLALELARRPEFQNQRVLLLDRDRKQTNDRTWCFWATDNEAADLPPIAHKTWQKCLFFGENTAHTLDIGAYRYQMVRGLDFYDFAKKELAARPNFEWLTAEIEGIDAKTGTVRTAAGAFSAPWVCNSIIWRSPFRTWSVSLLQHFKGWLVETPNAAFDPEAMTFMDFRVAQHGQARFVYVLPLSENRALVEFTVFSPALLEDGAYDEVLREYLHKRLKINSFKILDTEFGVIPMMDFPLWPLREGRVLNIGTAAGYVKGSSGYAFKRTQRRIRHLVDGWASTGQPDPSAVRSAWRFRLYDSIFLRVFADGLAAPRRVFSSLFCKQPAHAVFRFLDEDTTFAEEPRILMGAPFWPFLRAFFRQIPVFGKI